jgi:hypothetical protein
MFDSIIKKRKDRLVERGLLRFEAQQLCDVSTKNPYFEAVLKRRERLYKRAKGNKMTQKGWIDFIKKEYTDNGWTRITTKGTVQLDSWAMLRHFEDLHKRKQPEYTSPWQRKKVNKNLLNLDREKAKKLKDFKRREH